MLQLSDKQWCDIVHKKKNIHMSLWKFFLWMKNLNTGLEGWEHLYLASGCIFGSLYCGKTVVENNIRGGPSRQRDSKTKTCSDKHQVTLEGVWDRVTVFYLDDLFCLIRIVQWPLNGGSRPGPHNRVLQTLSGKEGPPFWEQSEAKTHDTYSTV